VSRTIALYTGPEMSALRTRMLRRSVQRALPLDGVLQIGTAYALPPNLRIATLEDMTVRQALLLPYPEWRGLSSSEQAAGVERGARAYSQAVACCFATRWAADSAITDYGVPREKTHVVGFGRNHSPRPAPRDWSVPRFLFVGGDWTRKNGDAVVRAFVRLRDVFPDARLDVAGSHPNIDAEGVTGHGWLSLADRDARTKLDRLFETATCFVMPSSCEPAGIAYVEAAAGGIPSIGTTVGGSAEFIGDGGCVVDPRDEQALYDAMLTLADGESARAAGQRALARANDFTWTEVARRVLAALNPPQT
jgi:glycosyltransferase involved in cell wall biosynthesis